MRGSDLRVVREDLVDRARAALERGSVVVVAPAGYGKTTLLEEVLAASAAPSTRLTCNHADRDPRHLLVRVVSAVAEAVQGASGELRERLLATTSMLDPLAVLQDLLDELDNLLLDPMILVIDEAEHLADVAASSSMLAALLGRERGRLHTAVISRQALSVPMARLRVRRAIEELGPADLAFSAGQCESVLELAAGRPPTAEEVDAVMAATRGWPLAVTAVCLRLGDRPDATLTGIVGGERLDTALDVRGFLAEEVLAGVDPTLRHHLVAASVPRYLTPAIAAELGLPPDFLEAVRAGGLFLEPADDHPGAVAFHPLFRECLLERLALERSDDDVALLHRCAGRAMTASGSLVDAIEHLLAAEDWSEAAAVMVAHGDELLVTAPQLMRVWMGRLPAAARTDPALTVIGGRLAWGRGDFDGAIAALRDAVVRWPADRGGEWMIRYALMQALFMRGDLDEAVAVADGFVKAPTEDAVVAAGAGMYAAHCLAALGQFESSEDVAQRARGLAPDGLLAPLDTLREVYLALPTGRLDDVADAATAMLAEVERDDPFSARASLLAALAFIRAQQGRLEAGLGYWRRLETEASESLFDFAVGPARASQAALLARLGRVSEAEAVLANVDGAGWGWAGYMVHVAQAMVTSARGDRVGTLASAVRAVEVVASAPPAYRAVAAGDLAGALLRSRAFDQAHRVLDEAQQVVNDAYPGPAGRLLTSHFAALRAAVLADEGDQAGSDDALQGAFKAGGAAIVHVLRREWEHLEALVWSALERGVLDVTSTGRALTSAFPDGLALVPFVDHPDAGVRRFALGPAVASGHPDGAERVLAHRDDPDPSVAAAAANLTASGVAAPPLAFTLLGGFEVRRGAWIVGHEAWGRPIAARLVRYLLVADNAVPEDVLIEEFWPDLGMDGARRSLQVAVSRVRRALDRPGATHSVVEARDGTYRLRLGGRDLVDSVEYRRIAARALAAPTIAALQHAASLWSGEPLPEERYADWAVSWRAGLVDQHAAVLACLADLHHAKGDHVAAIRPARELVALDPFNESAHRTLMVAYARAQRRSAALRQFLECRHRLVSELGVEPSADTARLQARIVAGEPV